MTAIICVLVLALLISLYDYLDSREWQHVTSATRNNVVFETRNKKYGAYSIRRDYNDLILLILVCILGLVGLFKIINSSFIDKTPVVAIVPAYDTIAITLEAPPLQEVQTVKTPYKIEGGGGSGTPSDAPLDKTPDPMIKMPNPNIISSNTGKTGKGNKTTGDNPNNPATSKNPNPFAHGSDGSGGGDNGGKGKGFGGDTGDGEGNGNGPGKGGAVGRELLKQPNSNNIKADEHCKVVLRVTIDANGDVVSASNNRDLSTTTNTTLINQVIALVKREAKYSAAPGSKNVVVTLTVRLRPN